jgi:hypothetical protein
MDDRANGETPGRSRLEVHEDEQEVTDREAWAS